jgi:arylsulfatase A-like enzyme
LHHGEKTIATYLSAQGYATGCFGKWHLGNMPDRGPRRFGFDAYFGLPFSNDTPPIALYRNEEVIEDPADVSSLSRRYADEAIAFIEGLPKEKPFFAYVPFTMPHYPVTTEPAFEGRSEAGPYGDVCEAIDHHCGRIYECIRQRGDLDNTIFVFTSDHGPWFEGCTGDARGRKFETWDGGTRIPFLLSWPAQVPGGRVIDTPVATVDVLPTLCAILGIQADPERPFDGQDLSALIEGEPAATHGPIWYFDGYQLNAVREGRWKLHRRRQTWGAERFAQMSLPQLFDMERDRTESYDLSARHPDVVDRLEKLMSDFEATLDLAGEDDGKQWWKAGEVKLLDSDEEELKAAQTAAGQQ